MYQVVHDSCFAVALTLFGCGGAAGPPVDPCDHDGGAEVTIPLFAAGARVSGVSSAPNHQTISATATLPSGCYSRLRVRYRLDATCLGTPPAGQGWPTDCDPFDRLTRVTLSDNASLPLVLLDAVTPFGGSTVYEQDVSDYAPAL